MNRETLISYAMSFLSFSFRRPEISSVSVNRIILFGSVARGDFGEESDIDIFIDTEKQHEENTRKTFEHFLGKFVQSQDHGVWVLRRLKNEIRINVGKLDEWDLKESVLKEGVMLFGKPSLAMKKQFLVSFCPVKNIAKRNRVLRKLFGRRERDFEDIGLVRELRGEMISPRAFMIPESGLKKILELFSSENVEYELKEIWQ